MKKLVVDLDYTIGINNMVAVANDFFGTDYTNENFPSYYLEDVYKNNEKLDEFLEKVHQFDVYKNFTIYKDCKRVLKQLSKYYEIYICTAYVWENIKTTKQEVCTKLDFLYNTFDFINKKNILFCANKDVICADVMIDDRIKNLTGNSKVKLLYTCPYNLNQDEKLMQKHNVTRVNNWQEIKNLLMKIK